MSQSFSPGSLYCHIDDAPALAPLKGGVLHVKQSLEAFPYFARLTTVSVQIRCFFILFVSFLFYLIYVVVAVIGPRARNVLLNAPNMKPENRIKTEATIT